MKNVAASKLHRRREAWLLLAVASSLVFLSTFLWPAGLAEGKPQSAQAAPAEIPPRWVQADWEYMTQGTGTWIADNSAYKNNDEPWDAYKLEWKLVLGKKLLKGRMLVIKDGKDVGAIWEFLSYWHPKEQRVVMSQWGSDGTYGTGTITDRSKNESVMQFFHPDGNGARVGHRMDRRKAEEHSQSFDISDDGVWKKRRRYIWKLVS